MGYRQGRLLGILVLGLLASGFAGAQETLQAWKSVRFALAGAGSPSLNSLQGRYAIQVHHAEFVGPDPAPSQASRLRVSTRLADHTFALGAYAAVENRGAFFNRQWQVQYAYTIRTVLGELTPGLGITGNLQEVNWSKLMYGDQIDSRLGFVNGTAERKGLSVVRYFDFPLSILMQKINRYYLSYELNGLLEPVNSVYFQNSNELQFRVSRQHLLNGGIALWRNPTFQIWGLQDLGFSNGAWEWWRSGLLVHAWQQCLGAVKTDLKTTELSLGWDRGWYRVTAKYRNTPNPFTGYWQFGQFNLSLAINVVKS